MKSRFKRTLIFGTGVIFVLVGIIGLALPFLQGVLFIVIGIILLSIASPAIRTWAERHTRKFPKIHEFVKKMEKRITDVIGLP
ncbi:hypothetical protein HY418_03205 [Candidatus Kaiserbacteria bacterium]|nr:hypothetical protein [Candidatus Kaiserbacteria bacterium]